MDRNEIWTLHTGEQPYEPSLAAVRLAAALSERLAPVVPAPFRVEAEGGWLTLYHGAGIDGSTPVGWVLDQEIDPADPDAAEWSFAHRARLVADNALSSVQDAVAEATAEQWPALPGGGMALPGTREDGASVYLWYGPDERAPVLWFLPIPLASLQGAG